MNQATANVQTTGSIVTDNGRSFPDDVYEETSRATGNQQWVADHWADGKLPTHSTSGDAVVLYTGTGNFKGFQYPDGRGKLKHYNHIQAIRTRSGLIIGDSSCYARGMAHCNYPTDEDYRINLTELKKRLRGEPEEIYDITAISGLDDDTITFESGRVYSVEDDEWSDPDADTSEPNALGL
jgi:hypothetical protein